MKRTKRNVYLFGSVSFLLLLVVVLVAVPVVQKQSRTRAAGTLPHVQGNKIIDGFGNPLILKGAHIQSSVVELIPSASTSADVQAYRHLNSATFDVMANGWNMNTVRIATSDWLWNANPTTYLQTLQNVVAQANQSGLYVVLSLHETGKGGLPASMKEPAGWAMPTPKALQYWQAVAATFHSNPMVMFDIYNEPHVGETGATLNENGWNFWLHGGTIPNTTEQVVGMQDLVNTIRQQGAQQILIVQAAENSFEKFEYDCPSTSPHCNFITDPSCGCQTGNIVYSVHEYFTPSGKDAPSRTPAFWDLKFGNLGQEVPIFIGEWEFSLNSNFTSRCDELSPPYPPNTSMNPDDATALVQSYLTYLDQHGTSWTTFAFTYNQSFTGASAQNAYLGYTPTSLYHPSWTCGQLNAPAGDGELVKGYLLSGLQSFTPTPGPTS